MNQEESLSPDNCLVFDFYNEKKRVVSSTALCMRYLESKRYDVVGAALSRGIQECLTKNENLTSIKVWERQRRTDPSPYK